MKMMSKHPALTALLLAATLILSACQTSTPTDMTDSADSQAAGTVSVVVTTTMLGDVTSEIVLCGGGTVEVLLPNGVDPHDFSASSDQVATMINADLVVVNGLGLESGLTDSLANATSDGANVFEVATLLDPIELGVGSESDQGVLDPHFWFDMNRMATAAELIGLELTTATGSETYTTCAQTVATQIRAAEGEVRALLESVPADKRILVTDHEALRYLADVYGYEVAGTVIPAGTTLAEPSSADLAALVATIQTEGITAIFSNTSSPTALADAVAAESGTDIKVIPLYVESLGEPGSPAATYLDMMRANAQLIADGLRG
jgi:zinc/manganese transport system substrate-binding protein